MSARAVHRKELAAYECMCTSHALRMERRDRDCLNRVTLLSGTLMNSCACQSAHTFEGKNDLISTKDFLSNASYVKRQKKDQEDLERSSE